MPASPSHAGRAGLREWAGLAVLALPTLLVAMDVTVLHLAVPELTRDLRPSGTELLWIVDIYGFLIAGWLIPMGVLGDRFGRRRVLLIGGAAFAVASTLAAFAPTPAALIASRALLGVAGATLMPSTLSLIRALFEDPAQRTFAIGVWVASLSLGTVVGPLVGGALLEQFWWGSVFLLAVPFMGLLLAVGGWLLPEVRDPEPGRLDGASIALALGSMLTLVYAIKQIAAHGLDPAPVASLVVAGALGAAFVRRQRRLIDPLIDLDLFRSPTFTAALSANSLGMLAVVGIYLFIAQYLQLVLGYGPLEAGLWLLPYSAAIVGGSLVSAPLAQRVGAGAVLTGGLVVGALGFALLGRIDGDGDGRDGPRPRARAHARDRPHRRSRALGARRRGVGDLGDRNRAGRRARRGDSRQPRRGDLPRPRRGGRARDARRGRRGRARAPGPVGCRAPRSGPLGLRRRARDRGDHRRRAPAPHRRRDRCRVRAPAACVHQDADAQPAADRG